MNRVTKFLFILATIIALCSCGDGQVSGVPTMVDYKEDFPNQSQDQTEKENISGELTAWEILHNFNWMGDDGNYVNSFADKPFLKKNNDGNSGASGICDINRDGEVEFLMAAYHVPRGIPSVEVFVMKDNQLVSIGGFFENSEELQDGPRILSYYKDKQDRLLFLRETEAGYGGYTRTLVATYTDDLHNVPIASFYSYYYDDEMFPSLYYVFPENSDIECTNDFVSGVFPDYEGEYDATEDQYNARISEFMDSLTWVEDVEYDYPVHYHLFNSHELPIEIRYKEISEGLNVSPPKYFHTPEEFKKTSDMVADALYNDYTS